MEKVRFSLGFFSVLWYNIVITAKKGETPPWSTTFTPLFSVADASQDALPPAFICITVCVLSHSVVRRHRWTVCSACGTVTPLSPTIPDAVLVTALLEAAERQEGDRTPLLYLCGTDNFSLLTQYRSALEAAYILCDERGTPLSEHTADHGIEEVLL